MQEKGNDEKTTTAGELEAKLRKAHRTDGTGGGFWAWVNEVAKDPNHPLQTEARHLNGERFWQELETGSHALSPGETGREIIPVFTTAQLEEMLKVNCAGRTDAELLEQKAELPVLSLQDILAAADKGEAIFLGVQSAKYTAMLLRATLGDLAGKAERTQAHLTSLRDAYLKNHRNETRRRAHLRNALGETITLLRSIQAAASGENQVAEDDTGGLAWIAEQISLPALTLWELTLLGKEIQNAPAVQVHDTALAAEDRQRDGATCPGCHRPEGREPGCSLDCLGPEPTTGLAAEDFEKHDREEGGNAAAYEEIRQHLAKNPKTCAREA